MVEEQFSLDGILLVHNAIRAQSDLLEQLAQKGTPDAAGFVQKRFELYWEVVESHHTFEDDFFFPVVKRLAPDFVTAMAGLAEDHQIVIKLMSMVKESLEKLSKSAASADKESQYKKLVQFISSLKEEMDRHLTREENVITPILARDFPVENQIELRQALLSLIPPDLLSTEIPWILELLDDDAKQEALKALPGTFRKLYEERWKKNYELKLSTTGK